MKCIDNAWRDYRSSRWARAGLVALAVGVLAGCSGGSAASSDAAATAAQSSAETPFVTEPASTEVPPTPTAPPAQTPTPLPTPLPTPTPSPTPKLDPIFTRIALPPGAGFPSGETRMTGSIEPGGDYGWTGVGFAWDFSSGLTKPLAWDETANLLVQQELPLPGGAVAAAAFDGATLAEARVVSGIAYHADAVRPAVWYRSSPGEPWAAVDDPISESDGLGLTPNGLVANEEIALLVLGRDDDLGESAYSSPDGIGWTRIDLADFNAQEFSLRTTYVARGIGIFIAEEDDGDGQQTWISDPQFDSWELHSVSPAGSAQLDTVVSIEGEPFGIGWSETTGAHGFWVDDDDIWRSQAADFSGIDFAVSEDARLSNLVAVDGRLLATLTSNLKRIQVVSDNALDWEADDSLGLEDVSADAFDQVLRAVVRGHDRSLISNGANPPVWVDTDGAIVDARSEPPWDPGPFLLPRTFLQSHAEELTLVTRDPDDDLISRQFSLRDSAWELEATKDGFTVLDATSTDGGLLVHGFPASGGEGFQMIDDSAYSHLLGSLASSGKWQWGNVAEEALSRDEPGVLIAYAFGDESRGPVSEIALIFNATDGGPEMPSVSIRNRDGYVPVDICSGRDNARSPVVLYNEERGESRIDVWIGMGARPAFEIGMPEGATEPIWEDTALSACERLGDAYMLSGSVCDFRPNDCRAMVWTSADGTTWRQHPDIAALADTGMSDIVDAPAMVETADGIILVASASGQEDDDSLWFVTDTTISPIRIGETFAISAIKINDIVSTTNEVIFVSGLHYFVASVDDVIDRVDTPG